MAQSFDEKAFLTRLFDQIVKEAGDSGLRAATAVRGDDFFYFRYQAGGHVGVVQLVGARVDNGAKFKVWFSVNELTAEPSAVP